MSYFSVPYPLAFVYTIVYHIYTFLFSRYGHTHDQYPQFSGEYAQASSRSSRQECTVCCYATFDSNRKSNAFESGPRLRRVGEAGGEGEEGVSRREVLDFRRSAQKTRLVIVYNTAGTEDISRLPQSIANRIVEKMDWFGSQKDPLHFAKPLIHSDIGTHRFRIGDYRVIVDLQHDDNHLLVVAVRHRSKAYE